MANCRRCHAIRDLELSNGYALQSEFHWTELNQVSASKNWTQDQLAAKIQLMGCYMTRDIIANIETRRRPVTDKQIIYFTEVFGVEVGELFSRNRRFTVS